MSEEDEDSDKQYEPSQKKLDDARKKGEIAKSADLTTAASYAGFLLALLTIGPAALNGLGGAMAALLGQSHDIAILIFDGSGTPLQGGILQEIFRGTAPWFLFPAVLATLSVIGQRAVLFTGCKVAAKLNRNPIRLI